MPEIAVCPKCQARYRTDGVKAGRRLRCRKCRTIFTVQEGVAAGMLEGPPPEEAALPAAIGDKSSLLRAQMSASIAPSLAPSADEEKYTVEDEIARGGMGAVLRAADRDLGREVAMKVMLDSMDERGRARFVEEARLADRPGRKPVMRAEGACSIP